jgi:cytochrome c-type biogenesis protein
MIGNLSVFLAFAAGLLSFLSPCVLPLVPSYICFIGGIGSDKPAPGNRRLITGTVSFIAGFTAVFVVLSILLSTTLLLLGGMSRYIRWVSGGIVIILGLNIVFDFIPFLNRELRFHVREKRTNGPRAGLRETGRAFLVGAAFGAGWTPCVGPILGSILLLAGQEGKTGLAALYLAVYSAGLGLPFLGAAVFLEHFLRYAKKLRARLPQIQRISGVFLTGIGFLILLGGFQRLNNLIMAGQYRFISWAQGGGPLSRFLPAGILLAIAAVPLCIRFLLKKTAPGRGLITFCAAFGVLAVLQTAELIDCAGLLARWLLFLQNV